MKREHHLILSPQKLSDRLHLSTGSCVLEISPGPGFFSAQVARRIPSGRLYAQSQKSFRGEGVKLMRQEGGT